MKWQCYQITVLISPQTRAKPSGSQPSPLPSRQKREVHRIMRFIQPPLLQLLWGIPWWDDITKEPPIEYQAVTRDIRRRTECWLRLWEGGGSKLQNETSNEVWPIEAHVIDCRLAVRTSRVSRASALKATGCRWRSNLISSDHSALSLRSFTWPVYGEAANFDWSELVEEFHFQFWPHISIPASLYWSWSPLDVSWESKSYPS